MPRELDPAAVARDVGNGRVSLQAAREAYGVVLNGETLEVDEAATTGLRLGNAVAEGASDPGACSRI